MMLNEIPFEQGTLETIIERLFGTMNAIEKQWSKKVQPASQRQIHALEEISGLRQYGKSISFAYLMFLETMGQNDNGLLEQEWDGDTEVSIDTVSECYLRCMDSFDMDMRVYMPFSIHWTECILFLNLTEGENPPVYYNGKLFSSSFENYLFRMAFRKMECTQFAYRIELAASQKGFRDMLSQKSAQNIVWTKPMELIEHMLVSYPLQKAWFSDEVHFFGISSEYSIRVDLDWALNIIVSSNHYSVLQKMKKSLNHLFGAFAHWTNVI